MKVSNSISKYAYKMEKLRKNIKITICLYLMQKDSSLYEKTQACESEIDQRQKQQIFGKSLEVKAEVKQNHKKEEANNLMERFCYEFCREYFDMQNQTLTIKDLTIKYGVKNRRVYDLLGILQGFSFVCKIKRKGTYLWTGVKNSPSLFTFEQNKSVALKDIAGLLRLLLINYRKGLSMKQLNQKIKVKVQQQTKRVQSKLTITRRIYECLKVMKIFGMVQKHENLYKITHSKGKKPCFQYQNKILQSKVQMRFWRKESTIIVQKLSAQQLGSGLVKFATSNSQIKSI